MPVTIVDPKQRDEPVPGMGFAVQMNDTVQGWFTECSGLSIEREVKAYPEGGVNNFIHKLPGRIKRSKVTLKHGLAGNELWDWFQKGAYDGQVERRNVSIVLYDVALTEMKRWDLLNVYPAKLSSSNFNSANKDIVVETLEFVSVDESSAGVQRTMAASANVQPTTAGTSEIDVSALAEKVYALLKQDLRVERERLSRR